MSSSRSKLPKPCTPPPVKNDAGALVKNDTVGDLGRIGVTEQLMADHAARLQNLRIAETLQRLGDVRLRLSIDCCLDAEIETVERVEARHLEPAHQLGARLLRRLL